MLAVRHVAAAGFIACAWLLAAGSCKVPGTLGLACGDDSHCDAGQSCGVDGVCVAGETAESSGTAPLPTTETTVGSDSASAGTTDAATASSSTDAPMSESSSSGPSCGQAIGVCDKVDVLIVMDNSGSMSEEFAAFVPALAEFTDLLDSVFGGLCSYHLGLTTTEVAPDYQSEVCHVRGALSRSGALLGGDSCFGDDAHPPYLDESDALTAIGCLFAVGQNYDDDEKQLDTALAALSPELGAPGACNEGFLRDDAALIVVFITDEDDDDDSLDPNEAPGRTGSVGAPTDWFDRLTAIKPPTAVGVLALIANGPDACAPWQPSSGNSDGEGAEYGERILTFMQHFTGIGLTDHIHAGNICSSTNDLVPQIADLIEVLNAVCEDSGL